MHNIVVVEIVPDVSPLKFTVIVVSVHLFSHRFVEIVVKETQKGPAIIGSHVKHEDQPSHVNECKHDNATLNTLHDLAISEICIGLQIGVCNHE